MSFGLVDEQRFLSRTRVIWVDGKICENIEQLRRSRTIQRFWQNNGVATIQTASWGNAESIRTIAFDGLAENSWTAIGHQHIGNRCEQRLFQYGVSVLVEKKTSPARKREAFRPNMQEYSLHYARIYTIIPESTSLSWNGFVNETSKEYVMMQTTITIDHGTTKEYIKTGGFSTYLYIQKGATIVSSNGVEGKVVEKIDGTAYDGLPIFSNTSEVYLKKNAQGDVIQARIYKDRKPVCDFDWDHIHVNKNGERFEKGVVHVQPFIQKSDGSWKRDSKKPGICLRKKWRDMETFLRKRIPMSMKASTYRN